MNKRYMYAIGVNKAILCGEYNSPEEAYRNTPKGTDYVIVADKSIIGEFIPKSKKELYNHRMIGYAEMYGIVEPELHGCKMIWYRSSYDNGYLEKPCIYKRTIDLRTGEESVEMMNRRPHGKFIQR